MENMFPTKRIIYQDREVPILMQNENGPCPLLALSNVLLLRGDISIHADVANVSFSDLTSYLAGYMLESNTLSESNLELRANQQQNLTDGMALFPKLNRGLDVNVRFDKVDGLEYSEDLVIFDLMHVRLLHGWLVDPQDRATHAVVGRLTYNQLVEKVISMSSPARPPHASAPSPSAAAPVAAAAAAAAADSAVAAAADDEGGDDDELQAALALSMQQPSSAPPSPPPSPPEHGLRPGDCDEQAALEAALAASLQEHAPAAGARGATVPERDAGAAESCVPSEPVDELLPGDSGRSPACRSRGGGAEASAAGETTPGRHLGEAMIAQDWLATSANQLTYYGLEQLHRTVNEGELTVFFRNNHFSTLAKYKGELYLLATDIGFLGERDIVWEKLNQVDGDSALCGSDFRPLDLELRAARNAADAAEAAEAAEVAAAAEAAEAARMQPGGGYGGGAPPAYPGATGAAYVHAQMGGDGGGEVDADYALALALQREEEQAAQEQPPPPQPPSAQQMAAEQMAAQQQQAAAQQMLRQQQADTYRAHEENAARGGRGGAPGATAAGRGNRRVRSQGQGGQASSDCVVL